VEYLVSHAHLALWARENGLLPGAAVASLHRAAARKPDEAAAVLTRAIGFRQALYRVLVGPARSADWTAVNAEVHRAATAATLRPPPGQDASSGRDGSPGRDAMAGWELAAGTGLDRPLLAVAWAAAELLTTPVSAAISVCAAPGCGFLFSDPTRRRRWCSMAECGNRAKARRHAARQRELTAGGG
jgi:predicted RNA-binding Zn ribbon-like protein